MGRIPGIGLDTCKLTRMACGATVGLHQCMREYRILETGHGRGMTGLASGTGGQMLNRLDHGRTRIVPAMTGCAIPGCSLEQPFGVAGFTTHILVPNIQRKPGPGVIKVSCAGLRQAQQRH